MMAGKSGPREIEMQVVDRHNEGHPLLENNKVIAFTNYLRSFIFR